MKADGSCQDASSYKPEMTGLHYVASCVKGDWYPLGLPGSIDTVYSKKDRKCESDYPLLALEVVAPENLCIPQGPNLAFYGSCLFTKGAGFGHYG